MAASDDRYHKPWFLQYTFPVSFPSHDAFHLSNPEFEAFLERDVKQQQSDAHGAVDKSDGDTATAATGSKSDSFTVVSSSPSSGLRKTLNRLDIDDANTEVDTDVGAGDDKPRAPSQTLSHPFIQGLLSHEHNDGPSTTAPENTMLTENLDVAYSSTTQPLLDLFAELEDVVSGPRLRELLTQAWENSPLMTMKIIFNARSIHLGKASRVTFYRCAGWLAQNHPLTLISNLRWLPRPIIEMKVAKKDEGEEDSVLVDAEPEMDDDNTTQFDMKNGVAYGSWKVLLNILVLSINETIDVLSNPRGILNVEKEGKTSKHVDEDKARTKRHEVRNTRHDQAVESFNSKPLKSDLTLLHGDDGKAKKRITLCAKWAPSHNRFHDKHTSIVSSIAELLHPLTEVAGGSDDMDRELYLRHAGELYRKDTSALRAHLGVVERNLSAKTLNKIKYERVPSIAMSNYAKIFAEKDTERFEQCINGVAEGKMRINGATLLPSTLVNAVKDPPEHIASAAAGVAKDPKDAVAAKLRELNTKVADGQWKTLVQRIRDSGTLENSIAVCDISGSRETPVFLDGICPMDSAIGLSLLLAEVTAPPFGGNFITFSAEPAVQSFDITSSLRDKWSKLSRASWDQNTNFVAVFEDLILPMAVLNKLKQEDMPVTADENGTAIVSGYSQGLLKVFLSNGSFDDPEEDEDEVVGVNAAENGEEGDDAVVVTKKRKMNPMSVLKKAIGHKAYDPLKVVD